MQADVRQHRWSFIAQCVFVFSVCHSTGVLAEETAPAAIEFNQDFLVRPDAGNSVNISRFSQSNVALAGVYLSDVYVNDHWVGKTELTLRDIHGPDHSAVVCVDRALLDMFNVDFSVLTPQAQAALLSPQANQCVQLADIIPDAGLDYDAGQLRLHVQIAQIALNRQARGYIHPRFWDRGVTAATVGYHFNIYRTQHAGMSSTATYLGLNNGLNLGNWHVRQSGAFTDNGQGLGQYQNTALFVQRDLVGLGSQLTIGDTYTSGQVFDSIGFNGVRLASDDRMLPESQVGYAPVVRGIAHSNAKVRVSQNGVVLTEITVAPGTFEINDLYATGYGGDLLVTILEATGEARTFTVPYTAFAALLRAGASRYSVTAGRTRQSTAGRQLPFIEAVAGYGVSNNVTLYGGVLFARQYLAGAIGAALSTPLGAVSFDVINARAQSDNGDVKHGSSAQLKYNKLLQATSTVLSLSAYRYTGRDYVSLHDVQTRTDRVSADAIGAGQAAGRPRHRLQLSINQPLGETGGAFFLSGAMQRYWGSPQHDVQYALGYSNAIGRMAYTLSMQRQQSVISQTVDHQFYVSLSMPLGNEVRSPNLMFSHNRNNTSNASMATVNGAFNNDGALTYSVSASGSGQTLQGSANGQYRGPYAVMNGTYSYGRAMTQMSASMSGGVVVHPGGVTLSQTLGESVGVVKAKDATGAQVNTSGVTVDRFGYAIVPSLTPYRVNQIDIDPKGLSMDVELLTSNQRVTPHAGAVVMLDYPTTISRALLIDATFDDGSTPPFGAQVVDAAGNYLGMTGQGGRIFVRGLNALSGVLTVKWGSSPDQRCLLPYRFDGVGTHGAELTHIHSQCMPAGQERLPEAMMPAPVEDIVTRQ